MKKLTLVAFAALSLAACKTPPQTPPIGDQSPVAADDNECPRADGQPCK